MLLVANNMADPHLVEIAYQVPDIDGKAKIMVNKTDTGEMIACVEAPLSNGKTVDTHGVSWATAIIAGMGLIASAVTSGLGHSNTAAHVAANALSLFGYFQAQAMVGMTAVQLPPIVAAWTQNFDWSMGIIKVGFMQDIFHWYIQATGGTPSNLFGALSEVSVQVMKRSIDVAQSSVSRATMYGFDEIVAPRSTSLVSRGLEKRSNNDNGLNDTTQNIKVSGIHRVAFKAGIEVTNFFMTGLAFFVAFLVLVALGVVAFKGICEGAAKMKWIKGSKFLDFRNGWLTVLKGIMYRLVCQWTTPSCLQVSDRQFAGPHWFPSDGNPLPLGAYRTRFQRCCYSSSFLLFLYDGNSWLGFI